MDIYGMMDNPWAYVALGIVLILLVALPLTLVRLSAAREKQGGDPNHDRHLG